MEITLQQTYAIISILFMAPFPIMWENVIRPQISLYIDRKTLVEYYRRWNLFLGQLNYRHSVVTSILVGIGVIFGVLSILQ